nr:MAG TPA: hypothetical protein [Caudoviricetes sp.]
MEKKNLRRLNLVVTSQTLYHLRCLAAAGGWGEKDLGRVVDKLVRERRTGLEGRETHEAK